MAANVWAGVCECITDERDPKPSCCKRAIEEKTSMSAKQCCEDECGPTAYVSPHRTQSDTSVKIPVPAGQPVTIDPARAVRFARANAVQPPVPFVDLRVQFPRPPNLYLKHHSFLI